MRERGYRDPSDVAREIDSSDPFSFQNLLRPVVQRVDDDAQFRSFIEKYYVGSANSSTVDRIMTAYPVDPDFVSQYVHPSTPLFLNVFF